MTDKPLPNLRPIMYAHRVHELQSILYSWGYALALHGSMQRDLDAIAVPWQENCCNADRLVEYVCEQMGLTVGPNSPTEKPHGRKVWTLMLFDFGFIDLSVLTFENQTELLQSLSSQVAATMLEKENAEKAKNKIAEACRDVLPHKHMARVIRRLRQVYPEYYGSFDALFDEPGNK